MVMLAIRIGKSLIDGKAKVFKNLKALRLKMMNHHSVQTYIIMTNKDSKNLLIKKIEWGRVELEDGSQFKDVMLAPSFTSEWNWKLSGTNHSKGIQTSDIDVLLEHKVDVLILSRGVNLVLQVSADTYAYAIARVPTLIVDQSVSAVAHYNRLVEQGKRVGMLLHSTC